MVGYLAKSLNGLHRCCNPFEREYRVWYKVFFNEKKNSVNTKGTHKTSSVSLANIGTTISTGKTGDQFLSWGGSVAQT